MNLPNRLQVGIDVSRGSLDFALLAPDGAPIEVHQPFANSLPGYQQAKALLLQALQAGRFEGLDVAAEATSYYWLPSFVQLFQDPELAGYDLHLYLLNARWVRWYKQSLSPDHKDDMTDPQYIADRIRTRKPTSTWTYDPKWLSLRMLTRMHAHLTKALVREKNLFQLYLFLAYNTYSHHQPFAHPLVQTSQKLLCQPALLEQLAHQPIEVMAELLYELSGHHLLQPQHNALRLQHTLRDSFPLPDELAATVHFMLNQLMETIQHLQADLRQVDQQIEHHLQSGEYPEVAWLDSIPGVGPVLSAGLAAEIAGLERFQRVPKWDKQRKQYRPRRVQEIEDAIGKIAGLWWPKNASGQFEAEERHMTKEGNAYLRYYILEAADRMRLHIPSYAAYYQKKYNQARKHQHKRAVALTGRKALGLFVALLHHKEPYRAKEGDAPFA
jgi:transposase